MATTKTTSTAYPGPKIASLYTLFFLYIEPLSSLLGAYYAYFHPTWFLTQTHEPTAPASYTNFQRTFENPPLGTHVVLRQLANLYLLFTLNEALVLRATRDLRVWRSLIFCLLIADLGHLWSLIPLGLEGFWSVGAWNAMDWGNRGVVYLGAAMRTAFLMGIGVQS